jgi:formylglycine-generating enzyme required for sulfatase activity
LPTEAEWEKAARGTDGRIYPWGNEWDGNRLNFCDKNCEGSAKDTTVDDGYAYTAPVGHYPSGASPYGALDVAGNVWEWAADWYDLNYYSRSPNANPQGPASGSRRVPRGGSWPDDREILRCAFRMWDGLGSDVRAKDIGFRVAGASSPLAGVAQPTLVPTGLVTQAPTSSPLPSATRTPARTDTPKPSATPVVSAVGTTPVQPVATKVLEPSGITMVYVPAGEFLMGSADSDTQAQSDEKPQHKVYLDGYWIGQTEVTNAQFARFITAGGYSNREYWTDDGWEWKRGVKEKAQPAFWTDGKMNEPDYPVTGVSWFEAAAYAKWAGVHLPTEAEWEKAARGTMALIYPWGNEWAEKRANTTEARLGGLSAVGSFLAGASPYGALDMAGSVWEWVADWYDGEYYAYSPANNPIGPVYGRGGVVRGGAWYYDRGSARCACRGWHLQGLRFYYVGFRVAE